jgi:hypothetical protein
MIQNRQRIQMLKKYQPYKEESAKLIEALVNCQ